MPRRTLDPLPLTAFHILLALADEDLHGYGIMHQVAAQTGNATRLGPGTLYGSIKTLLEAKLIKELDERAAGPGEERRRYYRITSAGKQIAAAEAMKMAEVLRIARAKRVFRGAHV